VGVVAYRWLLRLVSHLKHNGANKMSESNKKKSKYILLDNKRGALTYLFAL
jgi:hypothetical protein